MLYDEQQGHDAQLDAIAIDIVEQSVILRLSVYKTANARERNVVEMVFTNVEQVQSFADLMKLHDNRSAGNVNHWHIADGPGSSYFYLVEGCLVVTAATAPTVRPQ